MKQVKFNKSEVQCFLEEMIQMGLATDSEHTAYEQLMERNSMNSNTYDSIIEKMKEMWNEKF